MRLTRVRRKLVALAVMNLILLAILLFVKIPVGDSIASYTIVNASETVCVSVDDVWTQVKNMTIDLVVANGNRTNVIPVCELKPGVRACKRIEGFVADIALEGPGIYVPSTVLSGSNNAIIAEFRYSIISATIRANIVYNTMVLRFRCTQPMKIVVTTISNTSSKNYAAMCIGSTTMRISGEFTDLRVYGYLYRGPILMVYDFATEKLIFRFLDNPMLIAIIVSIANLLAITCIYRHYRFHTA